MSSSHPPFGSERVRRLREAIASPPAGLSKPLAYLAAPIRFVAFWIAVALPFLYLPLVAGGLNGGEPTAFLGLLATNVVALVVGHGHRADDARE
jgi:hypothetical protein